MLLIRVLIIEDDVRIADLLSHYVNQLDYVEVCGIIYSLSTALEQIEILQPDLILLDVYFADGNGTDLLQDLRTTKNPCDVIMITAATEVETLKAALHGGVFDYILKPILYPRIADSIKRYRNYKANLSKPGKLAQDDVDAFFQKKPSSSYEMSHNRLPKGIDPITFKKICQIINNEKVWTAERVGSAVGVSRTTARRYLEYLVSTNQVQAEVNYGGVGRPERQYRKQ